MPAGAEVDPRVLRTRRVAREAALTELAEVGFAGFTIESVAARAGMGKSTMYRHWRGRLDLIADALEHLNVQPVPTEDGTSPRARIELLVRHYVDAMARPDLSPTVPALIEASERSDEIATFFHAYNDRRRAALVDALREGVATGEVPQEVDPELAALALVGPVLYRRVMTGTPLRPAEVTGLLDAVLGPGPDR